MDQRFQYKTITIEHGRTLAGLIAEAAADGWWYVETVKGHDQDGTTIVFQRPVTKSAFFNKKG